MQLPPSIGLAPPVCVRLPVSAMRCLECGLSLSAEKHEAPRRVLPERKKWCSSGRWRYWWHSARAGQTRNEGHL